MPGMMDDYIRQMMIQMQMQQMMDGLAGSGQSQYQPQPGPEDVVESWPPRMGGRDGFRQMMENFPKQDPGIFAGQDRGGIYPPAGYVRRRDTPVGDVVLPNPGVQYVDRMANPPSGPNDMMDRRLQFLRILFPGLR